MLKRLALLLVGVIVVGLFAFGVFLGWASHKRTRAESLLRSIARLNLGAATFADAQNLAQKYGGEPWNGPSRETSCSSQNCGLRFAFDNKPLSYIPGVRGVEFVAGLTVRDGYVVSREVEYSTLTTSYFDFAYILLDGMKFTGVRDWEVKKLKVDAQGTPHTIEVNLGPLATLDERASAYSIDLSCLARLHGCSAPTVVFPPGL